MLTRRSIWQRAFAEGVFWRVCLLRTSEQPFTWCSSILPVLGKHWSTSTRLTHSKQNPQSAPTLHLVSPLRGFASGDSPFSHSDTWRTVLLTLRRCPSRRQLESKHAPTRTQHGHKGTIGLTLHLDCSAGMPLQCAPLGVFRLRRWLTCCLGVCQSGQPMFGRVPSVGDQVNMRARKHLHQLLARPLEGWLSLCSCHASVVSWEDAGSRKPLVFAAFWKSKAAFMTIVMQIRLKRLQTEPSD